MASQHTPDGRSYSYPPLFYPAFPPQIIYNVGGPPSGLTLPVLSEPKALPSPKVEDVTQDEKWKNLGLADIPGMLSFDGISPSWGLEESANGRKAREKMFRILPQGKQLGHTITNLDLIEKVKEITGRSKTFYGSARQAIKVWKDFVMPLTTEEDEATAARVREELMESKQSAEIAISTAPERPTSNQNLEELLQMKREQLKKKDVDLERASGRIRELEGLVEYQKQQLQRAATLQKGGHVECTKRLNASQTELEASEQKAKASLDAKGTELNKIKEAVTGLTTELNEARRAATDAEAKIIGLKAASKASLDAKDTELNKMKEAVTGLTTELTEARRAATDAEAKITGLKAELQKQRPACGDGAPLMKKTKIPATPSLHNKVTLNREKMRDPLKVVRGKTKRRTTARRVSGSSLAEAGIVSSNDEGSKIVATDVEAEFAKVLDPLGV